MSGRDHAGMSERGRVRSHNEDSFLVSPPLYAVADGLGGHQAGEVASRVAIDTLLRTAPRKVEAKALGRAVRSANAAVIAAAEEGRGRTGMGTTLTAAMVEGRRIAIAHVGDSRAYVQHPDGRLEQLTEDHSVVADMVRQGTISEEESRHHPSRSVITRALGSDSNMPVDTGEFDAGEGDRLLLCTDGLTSMLTDDEIAMILSAEPDAETASRSLVHAANAAGGHDNISVVVVDLTSADDETGGALKTWAARAAWVLAVIAVVALATGGAYRYARSRAYVVAEDGNVSLYRGVQGEFAGIRLHWLERETTVSVQALPPVTQSRLRRGVVVEDLQSGYELIETYRKRAEETSPAAPGSDGPAPEDIDREG